MNDIDKILNKYPSQTTLIIGGACLAVICLVGVVIGILMIYQGARAV